MIMCIQNLIKFCPFILKIWSKNQILESIKGCNSVANLRKTTIYNTNTDLVNGDVDIDFIVVLVTCKNEEDPIKNKGPRLFTTLYSNFSDAQGQITLELVVVSG